MAAAIGGGGGLRPAGSYSHNNGAVAVLGLLRRDALQSRLGHQHSPGVGRVTEQGGTRLTISAKVAGFCCCVGCGCI